jgi:hypothetical protein
VSRAHAPGASASPIFALFAVFGRSEAAELSGKLIDETAHFKTLEGNLIGESADRQFAVYVPPSYNQGRKHYPVLYLLHGFSDTYKLWVEDPRARPCPYYRRPSGRRCSVDRGPGDGEGAAMIGPGGR